MSTIREKLASHPLFSTLQPESLDALASCEVLNLLENEKFLPHKKKEDENYFLILEGQLHLISEAGGDFFILDKLKKNDLFSNLHIHRSFFLAKTNSTVLNISESFLLKMTEGNNTQLFELLEVLHGKILSYFEKLNSLTLILIRQKKHLGLFLINLTAFFSLFMIFVPYMAVWIKKTNSALITSPLVLVGTLFLITRLKLAGEPLSTIGIHKKNLKNCLVESFFMSLGVILFIIAAKSLMITFMPDFQGQDLFRLEAYKLQKEGMESPYRDMFLFTALYSIHAIFQEILVRGGVQGMFKQFLTPKRKNFKAVIMASIVFACAHSYFGIYAVMTVFLPGLFWGWLYNRQGNIWGPALSHLMIGTSILSFVGPP